MFELISYIHVFVYQIIINGNSSVPCFLNNTAGPDMWKNCGAGTDYIKFALQPWVWVTGGYFSMLFASVLIIAVYIKYHKITYPIIIGIVFMPFVYALFPTQFINFVLVIAFLGLGLLLVNAYVSQTTEQ